MLQQRAFMSEQDYEQLTLLAEDFPASHSPWLESKKVKGTIVTSGRKCSELSENLARVGSLVRMYLESSKLPGKQFVRTWSVRDTLSPFLILKLRLSERNTEGTGCSLWPTVRAGSNRNSRNAIIGASTGGKHKSDMGIEQAVEAMHGILPRELTSFEELPPRFQKMWPTPDASPRGARAVDLVVNPKTVCRRSSGQKRGIDLQTAVKLYPTPTARDYKGARKPETLAAAGRTKTNSLPDAVMEEVLGQLNPDWVELLMGFPHNWTSLNKKIEKEEWFQNTDFNLNPWCGDWEQDIPRTAKGVKHRVDRIKCLGNAVVPQQIYPIFKAIFEVENEQRKTNQPGI